MKATRWLLFAAFLAALVPSPAPLHAQPARDAAPPAPAAPTDAPTPPASDPSSSASESASSAGAPAPTDADSRPAGNALVPIGSAPVPTGGSSAPWNQGVSDESRHAARELFLEGNRLFRILLFARATEKYIAALRKWKHPRFYYNLAIAQIGLGQEVEARESLEHALTHGAAPLGDQEFKEAQEKLQEVKRQLGQLRVSCQTPGAEVTLDGVTLFIGPGSYQGWVKAKAHELTAKKAGYLPEARRVTVSAGELQDLELKLVTLSQATDASRRWAVWKPWVVTAAGGAIAAAGGMLHTLAARNFNKYDELFLQLDCVEMPDPDFPGCTEVAIGPHLSVRLNRARRQQALAVGSYIAGGTLIAAGVVLLYLNRPRLTEPQAPSLSARGVAILPAVSVDMLGIQVSVSH